MISKLNKATRKKIKKESIKRLSELVFIERILSTINPERFTKYAQGAIDSIDPLLEFEIFKKKVKIIKRMSFKEKLKFIFLNTLQ